ncbi:MAG: M14 family metallopeptidase [Bacteroidota bacterium]
MKYPFLFALLFFVGCKTHQASDFEYSNKVDTTDHPIELQNKKTYAVDGVFADNQFDGARLNDFSKLNDQTFQATIAPENFPINPSPWYAFKLWAAEDRLINLVLHYENGAHRYHPTVSFDGINWEKLDSNFVAKKDSTDAILNLNIGADTLWLAAQEIANSAHTKKWCETLAAHPSTNFKTIGKSKLGRDLYFLDINEGNPHKKEIIAVISRQHPPEVTGYFAMQAFIEEILADHSLASQFRKKYRILVFPLMNPDGVDLGHWRHNAGGIDLNRDWAYYHQPEIRQVADFMVKLAAENKSDIILGMDFHSTYYDIYYTNKDPNEPLPGFNNLWIFGIQQSIEETAKISPAYPTSPVSKNWFYNQFGAEGIVYEIGDTTPRDFIKKKGQVSAVEMMALLIYR